MSKGASLNLAAMMREFTRIYLSSAPVAWLLSWNPTQLLWFFFSPDQITSLPFNSLTPVQRMSGNLGMSHSQGSISLCRNSIFPGHLRVWTCHVPIFRNYVATASLLFPVSSPLSPWSTPPPVADLRPLWEDRFTQPQFLSWWHGPCFTDDVLCCMIVIWLLDYICLLFMDGSIWSPPPYPPPSSGLVSVSGLHHPTLLLHPGLYQYLVSTTLPSSFLQ